MDPAQVESAIAVEASKPLWDRAVGIWLDGGWAMIALAIVAFVIFGIGTDLFLTLRGKGFKGLDEEVWRGWIEHPDHRRGRIGRIMDVVGVGRTVEEVSGLFEAIRIVELSPITRSLRVMKTFVSAAPLLGLLGTVIGMLATFEALATGSGGDKTMQAISAGISEALITTQTGLVIALPGLLYQYNVKRTYERYRAFLAQLESACRQNVCLQRPLKKAA